MADAAIPLSFQFPKIPDATQSLMQGMSLRQMAAQAQQAPEHLRALQMQNQQTQQSLDDDKTARSSWMDSGGDPNKYQQLLMQRGANPATWLAFQQNQLAHQKQIGEMTIQQQTIRKNKAIGVTNGTQGILDMPGATPDEKTARQTAAWPGMVQGLKKAGYIQDESELPAAFPGTDEVTKIRNLGVFTTAQHNAVNSASDEQQKYDLHAAQMKREAADLQATNQKVQAATLAQDAGQLATSPTYFDYRKTRAGLANKARFPAFDDKDGMDTLTADHVRAIRQIGLTDEQATVAATAESNARRTQDNADRNFDLRNKRDQRETILAHKELIGKLADQATAESVQGGGGSIDNALSNVDPKSGFYQGNHPINQNRGEVQAELERRKRYQLGTQNSQDKADEAAQKKAIRDSLGFGTAPASGGQGGTKPAIARPAPAAQPKPAQQPAVKVATMQHVRDYAKQKGISEAAALSEFKGYGYKVQ